MADEKISALPAATVPLAGTEAIPGVQSGQTVKFTATDVSNLTSVNGQQGTITLTAADVGAVATVNGDPGPNVVLDAADVGAIASVNGDTGPNVVLTATDVGAIPAGSIIPIAQGGTGQTTANTALNALLPSQTAQAGKVLGTDGTNTSWVSQAGGAAIPGTIPDLQFWFESDNVLIASGALLPALQDRTPWIGGARAISGGGNGPVGTATTLNSLPVINFNNTSAARLALTNSFFLKTATFFVIFKPTAVGVAQSFICGAASSLQFRLETTGSLGLVKANVAGIGTSSGTLTAGTWYQANATYDDSSGAYAFRISQANSGSGNSIQTITAATSSIGFNAANNAEDVNGMIAALVVYNRVLSGSEITAVEGYLHTKWGV